MEPLIRALTAAVVIAAVLLRTGEADAQSSGGGLSNLFGNVFSGQNSTAPVQPQTTPGSAAPPWSGEARDPPSGGEFR